MPAHVRKGDTVIVRSGSHKGQIGEILSVDPTEETVVIKGVNLVTRHLRPTRTSPQGGVVTREAPLHWSKVNPVIDGKPSRVRFETRDDGSKVRVAILGDKVLGQVRGPRDGSSPAKAKAPAKAGTKPGSKSTTKPAAKAAKPKAAKPAAAKSKTAKTSKKA